MRTITLSGPAKNALGTSLMQHVHDEVHAAGGEPLLLTGEGDAFSAGLNLKEVLDADMDSMRAFHHLLEDTVAALYHYPGPTAAAVNGHAIAGGAILGLVCDRRIATTNPRARIGLNEVALGLQLAPRPARRHVVELDRVERAVALVVHGDDLALALLAIGAARVFDAFAEAEGAACASHVAVLEIVAGDRLGRGRVL